MKKPGEMDEKGHPKFGTMDKLAYAAGDLGCNMSFSLKGTVQTFWLTYMMLETGLLSILLLLVQIWDAVNDPIIGAVIDADTRRYKRGKFKTYILIGAIGLIFGGAAVFLPFPNASTFVKAMLFIVGYMIWDAAYTAANVPYGAMMSLITEDAGERAQLSTWRSIGSLIGNILPGIILPLLIWKNVFDENGQLLGQELKGISVFVAALIMGVIAFFAFLFMIRNTILRVDEYSVKTGEEAPKFNVFKAFGNFMKNRPAVGATLAAMGMFLGMQSAATANAIMFATYFKNAQLSGIVMLIGFLPMFLFMPFIKNMANRFGKKESATVGSLVSVAGGLIMMVFPMVPQSSALPVYMAGLLLFGLGLGVYTCVSWALMADAIDYSEWKTGKREEGTVYSLHSFFRKLAQGIGPSIIIALLGALGYVSELGTTGQSAEVAHRACWLVAGLYLFSAVMQFIGIGVIFNLDKKTLTEMNNDLNERRLANAA